MKASKRRKLPSGLRIAARLQDDLACGGHRDVVESRWEGRRSQVARQDSAKVPFAGSNPAAASFR